ncbi:hypothetical protein GOV03_00795 [Candidatus Woesearchaeota archaeon]|nr:hypothetical protein [Candidatus Woesearchaeota archaeon]
MTPLEAHQTLTDSEIFQNWQKDHSQTYLSHFYCQLDVDFKQKSPWDIGFYDPKTDKIAVFKIDSEITLLPEDKAFKKQGEVEELKMDQVTVDFPQALEIFQKTKEEHHSSEILLNGFLILQKYQEKTMWNISFATKSLSILNIKIDATNQEVISHQSVNFINQNAAPGKAS